MEPSDERASDGRIHPVFGGLVPDGDGSTQKRRRSSTTRPKVRPQATTLFAAWGQEKQQQQQQQPPFTRAEPIQLSVRGTGAMDGIHPFFAKREGKSVPTRTRAEHARPIPTVHAPWPRGGMAHVAPACEVQRRPLSWPRKATKAKDDALPAPRHLAWLRHTHAEPSV